MKSSLYKNYFIIGSARYDPEHIAWKPSVTICWKVAGRQQIHLLPATLTFKSRPEAERFAFHAGQKWVDEHDASTKPDPINET